MAVLDAHPGLSTVVTVNKQPLTEYDNDEETDPGVANKYVEASSGAEFVIETVIKSPFPTVNGVEISVTVDGSRGPRFGYGPDELLYRSIQVKGVSITQGGERHRQNYQISELNVVEENEDVVDLKSLRKEIESKGRIEVSYRWITNFRNRKERNSGTVPAQQDNNLQAPKPCKTLPVRSAILEKALKGDARSHRTILGEPQLIKSSNLPRTTYDYVSRDPFGTVHFHYRSRAALKALRIVVDEETKLELNPEPEPEHPTGIPSRRISQRKVKEDLSVKQEVVPQRDVKRERIVEEVVEDPNDLSIVETRSYKRSRGSQEVIVLD